MTLRTRALTAAALGCWMLVSCSRAEPTLLPQGSVQPGIPAEFRIQSSEILQAESWPVQVSLEIAGILTSSCHELETQVYGPDGSGQIRVEVVEEIVEETECRAGGEAFREAIPLGNYTEGRYEVLLNGESVGTFDLSGGAATEPPPPDDEGRDRGPIYLDEVDLLVKESFPVQVELVLRGALPTPCASLQWVVEPADDRGRIDVVAYSLQDPAVDCIQVLEPLEEAIPLGSYSQGTYTVWLNGTRVGEFSP